LKGEKGKKRGKGCDLHLFLRGKKKGGETEFSFTLDRGGVNHCGFWRKGGREEKEKSYGN